VFRTTESYVHYVILYTCTIIYSVAFQSNIHNQLVQFLNPGCLWSVSVGSQGEMDAETRFRLFEQYFTCVGNPILTKRKSVTFRIYSVITVIVAYGCWLGEYIESFRHLDDLAEMQDPARIAIPLTAFLGVDLYIRWAHLVRI
jgi:hypothetical protein